MLSSHCLPKRKHNYSYKEFKILRLKAKKTQHKKEISLIPKLIFLLIFFVQTIHIDDASYQSELKSIQKKDFFCMETIKMCRNFSYKVLNEKLNFLALSKLKPKNHNNLYKFLLLLSGDIELNPGPTRYPCAICKKGVRSKGVCCTNCGFWVHPKCEKISNIEYKKLSRIPKEKFTFTCSLCQDENSVPDVLASLPFYNENIR